MTHMVLAQGASLGARTKTDVRQLPNLPRVESKSASLFRCRFTALFVADSNVGPVNPDGAPLTFALPWSQSLPRFESETVSSARHASCTWSWGNVYTMWYGLSRDHLEESLFARLGGGFHDIIHRHGCCVDYEDIGRHRLTRCS